MTAKSNSRTARLMPSNIPKYIRCYDNEENGDRYTCVFTGKYRSMTSGEYVYLGMSNNPFHPQGIGMTGYSKNQVDYPKYSHLGKRIKFINLPEKVKKCIRQTYICLWELK